MYVITWWRDILQDNILTALYRSDTYRDHEGVTHLPSSSHIRRQGSRTRSHSILQAIQVDQAIPTARHTLTRRMFPFLKIDHFPDSTNFSPHRAKKTASPQPTARSSTACTNVSCAPAARHPAHRTGGTPTSTSAPRFCFSHIDGWPTHVTSGPRSARKLWTTA